MENKEHFGAWAAEMDMVDLAAEVLAIGADLLRSLEVGHRIAAELENDEADVHLGIGGGEFVIGDEGELLSGATSHGDVVNGYAGAVIDKDRVEVGIAVDAETYMGGDGIELPHHATDAAFCGILWVVCSMLTVGQFCSKAVATVVVNEGDAGELFGMVIDALVL